MKELFRKATRVVREPHLRKQLLFHPIKFIQRTRMEGQTLARVSWKWTVLKAMCESERWLQLSRTVPFDAGEVSSNSLGDLFTKWGSDKATRHHYHRAYSLIVEGCGESWTVVEIGLGTADPSHQSTMGSDGTPGASLRAWNELPSVHRVFGGDNSISALESCSDLDVEFVDQLDDRSLADFFTCAVPEAEPHVLVVDDGLHAPGSNLRTFFSAAQNVTKSNLVIVIEDVHLNDFEYWGLLFSYSDYEWVAITFDPSSKYSSSKYSDVLNSAYDVRSNLIIAWKDDQLPNLKEKFLRSGYFTSVVWSD